MIEFVVRLVMAALLSATCLWPAVASAQSQTDPTSAQQRNENQAAPIIVIDAFLVAQGEGDLDAAEAFFEPDALIIDSSGRSAFGTYAVRRLIDSVNGWEAGPRLAIGQEVTWAESLPIWRLSTAPTDFEVRLEQEVPHYAYVEIMCAVVTDGKIHALSVLAAGDERSCEPALNLRIEGPN